MMEGFKGLRSWTKRLEQARRGDQVEMPQVDGSVARFPESALSEAYLNNLERLRAESAEDAPPEHPLIAACRNSSDPEWRDGLWLDVDEDPEDWTARVEDLSE